MQEGEGGVVGDQQPALAGGDRVLREEVVVLVEDEDLEGGGDDGDNDGGKSGNGGNGGEDDSDADDGDDDAGMTAPLAMAASVTRIVLGSVQVYYVGTLVLSRPVVLGSSP